MATIFSHSDILALDKNYRTNLINTVAGVKSVHLIGTQNNTGHTNLAVFNSVIHIGANPPSMGFIMRPLVVERHTYNNIKEQGYFTINHVSSDIYQAAHQTSAKYERNQSEFKSCGFAEEYIDKFKAPFVKESQVKIGLSLVEEHPIRYNGTILIVGKIETLVVSDEHIEEDGSILHSELQTIAISGLYSYYSTNQLDKLDYARPIECNS